jgi:hypothetical protein
LHLQPAASCATNNGLLPPNRNLLPVPHAKKSGTSCFYLHYWRCQIRANR